MTDALHTWTEYGVLLGETVAPVATAALALQYSRDHRRPVVHRRVTAAIGGPRRRHSDVHYGEWRTTRWAA